MRSCSNPAGDLPKQRLAATQILSRWVGGSVGLWHRIEAFKVALRGEVWAGETVLLFLDASCPPRPLLIFPLSLYSFLLVLGGRGTQWVSLADSCLCTLQAHVGLAWVLIYSEFTLPPSMAQLGSELSGARPQTDLSISEHWLSSKIVCFSTRGLSASPSTEGSQGRCPSLYLLQLPASIFFFWKGGK